MRSASEPAAGGLTLLELVIALAVLAILGALMLPGMGSQLQRQRLQNAAETLTGDINETRFLAAQKGYALHVRARDGAQWCWSVAAAPDCDCAVAAACAIHRVSAADHPGVRLLEPLDISLDPGGTAAAAGGTSFGSAEGDRLRVEVSQQGRARICAAAGKWPRLKPC